MDRTFHRRLALRVRTGTIGEFPLLWAGLTSPFQPAPSRLAGGITCTTALRGGTITTIAAHTLSIIGGEPQRGPAFRVSIQRTIGQARSTMIMVRT